MIPYMVGKLAPNSTHFTKGLVKYVPGRGYFRAVPSQNGDNFVTSPPPPIFERLILLFTQVPILVRFDGTIVDISTILLQCTNNTTVFMLGYDWWLWMVINISVQYSGGFLPDIIVLTQGYYHWGTRLL